MVQVLIDYLTLSSKIHDVHHFIDCLGLLDVNFISMGGRYGWSDRLYYRGISLFYGGRDDICLEISGTGCRTVEELNNSFDWYGFFQELSGDLSAGNVHISRLDMAADDHEGILSFHSMLRSCSHHRYICKARFCTWTDGSEQVIYFGSPSSDRRVRIYNKALESDVEGHWLRVEMQMRNDCAMSFILNWFNLGGDVGDVYASVLRDYLRFTTSRPEGRHHDRCKIQPWWNRFLGESTACCQLYLHARSYSLPTVCAFLDKQASSSLKLWLMANNGDFEDIIAMIEGSTLNKRQKLLLEKIEEYGKDVVL